MTFRQYIESCFFDLPFWIYLMAISLFVCTLILLFYVRRKVDFLKISSKVFLMIYVFMIYASTVCYRSVKEIREYNYSPLWSYYTTNEDSLNLKYEIIMNIIAFVPIGFALACIEKKVRWWLPIVFGGGISLTIEASQYIFKRGFSELDDVIHNTIGCTVGYILYFIMAKSCRYFMNLFR